MLHFYNDFLSVARYIHMMTFSQILQDLLKHILISLIQFSLINQHIFHGMKDQNS